jgi:hypothetical protein
MPGREEAAGFVERGADETSMDDPGRSLVAFVEGEGRLVALDPLLGRRREVEPIRIVATTPATGVMVGRYALYRRPPRSKCAL